MTQEPLPVAAYIFLGTTLATVLLLCLFAVFVYLFEYQRHGLPFFSPVNRMLLAGYLGLAIVFSCEFGQFFVSKLSEAHKTLYFITTLARAIVETCSVQYFWLICCTVVDLVSPELLDTAELVVNWIVSLVLLLLQIIPAAIYIANPTPNLELIAYVSAVTCWTLALTCNSFFVCLFAWYLYQMRVESPFRQSDPKLYTIFRHGVAFLCSSTACLVIAVSGIILQSEQLASLSTPFSVLSAVFLFSMKVFVWRRGESERTKSLIHSFSEEKRARRASIVENFAHERRRSSQLTHSDRDDSAKFDATKPGEASKDAHPRRWSTAIANEEPLAFLDRRYAENDLHVATSTASRVVSPDRTPDRRRSSATAQLSPRSMMSPNVSVKRTNPSPSVHRPSIFE